MPRIILQATGGTVTLPDPRTVMIDHRDGGQLVVYPRRRVWDRTALEPAELVAWNALIAATARAMLETLPQLEGGCINYWDAGNWALHPDAEPVGAKTAPAHRFLHQHLVGRSPRSADPDWQWGESPFFPRFADRLTWSAGKTVLTADECAAIERRAREVLTGIYGVGATEITAGAACARCRYPTPGLIAGEPCGPCAALQRA